MKNFRYALQGLLTALRSEKNLRFHIAASVVVIATGFWKNVSAVEWLAVTLCIAAVVSMELMNTALEYLCNAVEPNHHPFIKQAKDIAAAAVFITAIASLVCGLIIFLPKFFSLINQQ
jgi:diacylglycerol kinase